MADFVQDPRAALDRLLADKGIDYARLSQVIGRNPAYIQQYIKRGSPRRLAEQDRARIAAYLGVSEAMLGGPVQRVAVPARVRGPGMILVPIGRASGRESGCQDVSISVVGVLLK